MSQVFDLVLPVGESLPLLYDSPHSGLETPPDWAPVASSSDLLTSWDAFVDELFGEAPASGATLLRARFPRSFVDLNRRRDDIDPGMLDGGWVGPLNPGPKSARGFGLLRRLALPGVPVYAGRLPVAQVRRWVETYYDPYHATLRRRLDELHQAHGFVWHIDCHSMKSVGNAMNDDIGKARPDFVLSDKDGTSADPAFTAWVADLFRKQGYTATINDPYKGAELVEAYGRPEQKRYSIQIEVNRGLYMDEAAFEKGPGFKQVRADIGAVVRQIAARARDEMERCKAR